MLFPFTRSLGQSLILPLHSTFTACTRSFLWLLLFVGRLVGKTDQPTGQSGKFPLKAGRRIFKYDFEWSLRAFQAHPQSFVSVPTVPNLTTISPFTIRKNVNILKRCAANAVEEELPKIPYRPKLWFEVDAFKDVLGERQSIFFIFVTRNLSRRSNHSPWVWIYSPLFQSSDLQKKIFFHFSSTKFWKTDDHKTSLSQTFTSVCASKMFFYFIQMSSW